MSNAPDSASIDPNGEAAAAAAARTEDPAANTRRWLLQTTSATLCTTSSKTELEGYPFGSVVPFCLTSSGQPAIFIAGIAAHTANLRRDARASLFVHDPDAQGDPQKSWRVTVMGKMRRLVLEGTALKEGEEELSEFVSAEELDDIRARYEQRVPFAIDYNSTHDFSFWRMSDVERVRYIAGFGKICWVSGEDVRRAPLPDVAGAISHMNADHVENMREICAGFYDFRPDEVEMTTLDQAGFHLRTKNPDRHVYIPFGDEIEEAGVRKAIIGALEVAREQIRGASDSSS